MKMDGSGAGWAVRAIVRVHDSLGGFLGLASFVFSALCIPVWVQLTILYWKLLVAVLMGYWRVYILQKQIGFMVMRRR